jgi:TolB protein
MINKIDMKLKCCKINFLFVILWVGILTELTAQRALVLNQIDLPHNYYFRELYLPQLTSGPSAVAWSPDGKWLCFSMGGSLWKQALGSETALQLTDGDGYDYQPDWSPDGNQIIFVRYNGSSVELMALDVLNGKTSPLTNNNGVNLEPRWSPDGRYIAFVSTSGTGHFLLYKARMDKEKISELECLTPDHKSSVKRYYYSAYDHAINPVWSHDGKEIYFISNRETAHGTGDIVSFKPGSSEPARLVHHEETSWATRPDISPDGTRMVYSSYMGRSWHQLWLLPAKGGYPFQLTYGDYDNTGARWSPDGQKIAFISNREGNTSLWLVDVFGGNQQKITTREFGYLQPRTRLIVRVQDDKGVPLASRVTITG